MAQDRIKGHIRVTPLEYSRYFSTFIDAEVYLKQENLQKTGSFKLRGVLNKILKLEQSEKESGIVTASAGNHGQAVGYACKSLGIPATVVVPENTPSNKRNAIRLYGVEVIVTGKIYDEAETYALELARQTDQVYLSPYNDLDIIAGQATIALEILAEVPEIGVILVPLGGGGLISGIAAAMKSVNPEIQIIGVQSEASPVWTEYLKVGKIFQMDVAHSIAEGLHGNIELGSITFPLIQQFVDEILLVSETEIRIAILDLLKEHRQVVEPSGAVGVAALQRYPEKFKGKKIAIVISGANIEFSLLKQILCES